MVSRVINRLIWESKVWLIVDVNGRHIRKRAYRIGVSK